jgi:hypothetical protein
MINHTPGQCKLSIEIPTAGEITFKAEKAGYTLWEEYLIIAENETVTMLMEMEAEA